MSSVAAVAAPFASEIVLMGLGLWHYPEADVFIAGQGVVSWVMWWVPSQKCLWVPSQKCSCCVLLTAC